jgi:hypothetical protein
VKKKLLPEVEPTEEDRRLAREALEALVTRQGWGRHFAAEVVNAAAEAVARGRLQATEPPPKP